MFKHLKHISVALAVACIAQGATALDLPTQSINGQQYYYYRIQPKETVYSLTNKLGLKRGDIVKYNPSAADGLRAGDTLYFPVADFTDSNDKSSTSNATTSVGTTSVSTTGAITHQVAKGETLYAISKRYGVSMDDIIALNPDARDGIKAGSTLIITNEDNSTAIAQHTATEATTDNSGSSGTKPKAVTTAQPNTENVTIATPTKNTPRYNGQIDIAIMLPFMLDKSNPSKQALLYTDFYKGLLMAVDTLRASSLPIHIHAYDTADDLATVKSLLRQPEMAKMDIIIAPEDSLQIEAIAQFADDSDARVLNLFAVKNNSYLQHPSLINANIPHEMMYRKAIDNFIKKFNGYIPVLLVNGDNDGDKKAFIDTLRRRLVENNTEYREVTYSGSLRTTDLEWMDITSKYVFIPSSGARAELQRLLPTLIDKREDMATAENIRIFGYPEWVILRGDIAQKLHKLDAVIYSRFVYDSDDYRTRRLERRFQEWYGTAMTQTAPMQGTLGYDTGSWIIKALSATPGEDISTKNFVYYGLQSGFDLSQPTAESGMINEALYFINFLSNGETEKVVL
jgi:LysM repeat protein